MGPFRQLQSGLPFPTASERASGLIHLRELTSSYRLSALLSDYSPPYPINSRLWLGWGPLQFDRQLWEETRQPVDPTTLHAGNLSGGYHVENLARPSFITPSL